MSDLIKEWDSVLNVEGVAPIKNAHKKSVTARLLENTEKEAIQEAAQRGMISEGTNQANIDMVDPVLINLVRRTQPNLLAYDMVGVQPMTGPTGLIFAMRSVIGTPSAGPHSRPGDARAGFEQGDTSLTSGLTNQQQWAEAGYVTNEANYFEPNTTKSGTGTQSPNDGTTAYADYSVGTGIGTGTAETAGRGLSGDYVYNEMGFTIEKVSVEAKTRLLKASYTIELAQDLKNTHGLDAETELANLLSAEILNETNREIINRIRQTAKIAPGELQYASGAVVKNTAGAPIISAAGLFDLDKNSDGRWSAEKYKSLLLKIAKECNAIAKDTRRGRGNFIIVSSDVAAMLDLAGKIDYAPAVDNNLHADDTGATFVGMLQGRIKVYIDPFVGYDEVIVGYKGPSAYDAGFFYCPYVPLQMLKSTNPNTFQPSVAYKTRYGIVANPFTTLTKNSNTYYRKFRVSGV